MSVINKMLQDLDARQNGTTDASHLYTKPAAFGARRFPAAVIAGVGFGVAVIAAASVFGWRYWQKTHHSAVAAAPVPAKVIIVPAPPAAPAAAVPVLEAADVASAPAPAVEPAAPAPAKPHPHKRDKAPASKHEVVKKRGKHAAKEATAAKADKPVAQGKEETTAQKAESAYRRGLSSIQDGYLNDGIASLEQALQANPQHDAARQTLVRVLIDNRRSEEASRVLQAGLALDPRQPSMAMLLARLQIEHGGTGIDTLMRTLPYAGNNGEYHAFLAGALQRQQRHREAAEQYQSALRAGAQNGVWLMGLGISLQAERRDAEALDAFRKAKSSGTLSAELRAFVDDKIHQLAR